MIQFPKYLNDSGSINDYFSTFEEQIFSKKQLIAKWWDNFNNKRFNKNSLF